MPSNDGSGNAWLRGIGVTAIGVTGGGTTAGTMETAGNDTGASSTMGDTACKGVASGAVTGAEKKSKPSCDVRSWGITLKMMPHRSRGKLRAHGLDQCSQRFDLITDDIVAHPRMDAQIRLCSQPGEILR